MTQVKRYNPCNVLRPSVTGMSESLHGDYVLYDDYAVLMVLLLEALRASPEAFDHWCETAERIILKNGSSIRFVPSKDQ